MQKVNLTPEQEKDSQERIEAFRKDYVELVKKHEVDLVSFPTYVQNPNGAFLTIINTIPVDKKYLPVPTPFDQNGDVIKKQ